MRRMGGSAARLLLGALLTALSAADELAPDCDLHDDAVANASCP